MALAFPPNPTVGQVYRLWVWDGQKWACNCGGGGGGGGDVIGNGVIGMPSLTIVFNNSGTYTPSTGITSIMVECIGGGGAGGPSHSTSGNDDWGGAGGGGSGGYSRSVLLPGQIGSSQPVTIGQGGAATTTSAAPGGMTTFGTLVTANGGQPGGDTSGSGPFASGGAGATRGTGTFTLPGTAGGTGIYNVDIANSEAIAGGGGVMWGGSAPPPQFIAAVGSSGGTPGLLGVINTGAGGSGAAVVITGVGQTPAAQPGGAGGAGVCIITEYSA